MLAGEICLEASKKLSVFLRMASFQLRTLDQSYLKISNIKYKKKCHQHETYFPCQALMSPDPSLNL